MYPICVLTANISTEKHLTIFSICYKLVRIAHKITCKKVNKIIHVLLAQLRTISISNPIIKARSIEWIHCKTKTPPWAFALNDTVLNLSPPNQTFNFLCLLLNVIYSIFPYLPYRFEGSPTFLKCDPEPVFKLLGFAVFAQTSG